MAVVRGYDYERVAEVHNVREPILHALADADAVAVSRGATGAAMQLLFPQGAVGVLDCGCHCCLPGRCWRCQLSFMALLGVYESSLCVLLKILMQLLFVSSLAVPERLLCVLPKMLLLFPRLPLVLLCSYCFPGHR